MVSWQRIIARSCLPGLSVLILALLTLVALGWLGTSRVVGGYLGLYWLALCGVFLGIAMLGWTTCNLWRWHSGHAPRCSVCAGMLGRKRARQGMSYRRCLACARKNARR